MKVIEIDYIPIKPIDFIEADAGRLIPFSLFCSVNKDSSTYGQMKEYLDSKNPPKDNLINDKQMKKIYKDIFDKTVIKEDDKGNRIFDFVFDFDEFFELNKGLHGCLKLLKLILEESLILFRNMYNVQKINALHIDAMSKRYGKTPIEIFCTNPFSYNDLDALLFNSFIFNVAMEEENKQAEKRARRAKHGR